MKPIHILLLFLFLPALVTAQLEGEYVSLERYESYITLNTDSSFYMYVSAGTFTGKGIYHLSKDKLILVFDKDTSTQPKTNVNIQATSQSLDTDSITITGTTCELYNNSHDLQGWQSLIFMDASRDTVKWDNSDPYDDPWIIKLPRSRNILTGFIEADRGCYYKTDFQIIPDRNYSIDIRLKRRRELHDLEFVYDIKYVDGAIDNKVVYLKRSDKKNFIKFTRQ